MKPSLRNLERHPARRFRPVTRILTAVAAALLASAPAAPSAPGRLPLRTYTVLDGLAGDQVNDLLQDSRGYLWVATSSGVSRFDGSTFLSFLEGEGSANRIAEGTDGAIWVGTDDALFRLDPSAPAGPNAFERVIDGAVTAIRADTAGNVWVGGGRTLFRLRRKGGTFAITREEVAAPFADAPLQGIRAIAPDGKGRLWLATHWGLVCRLPDGRQVHYEPVPGKASGAFDVAVDRAGRVWVGTERLLVLAPRDEPPEFAPGAKVALVRGLWAKAIARTPLPAPDGRLDLPVAPGEARAFGKRQGLVGLVHFGAVTIDREGRVWIGTNEGLNVFEDGRLRSYGPAQGVPRGVSAILEDAAGDLWFGTTVEGLRRMRRRGFVAFGPEEGLPSGWTASVFETRDGRILAATRPGLLVSEIGAGSIRATGVRLPASIGSEGWGWGEVLAEDRTGMLWLASESGLYGFPPGALDDRHPSPARILDTRGGLGSNRVFRLFLDSRNDLWVSTFPDPAAAGSTLTRVHLPDGPVRSYSARDGIPGTASTIAESPDGSIWFGLYGGGLARERDGRFRTFGKREGVPHALVSSLWFQGEGVMWAATEGRGLLRVGIHDDAIEVRRITHGDGLSSDTVKAVVGDGHGALWVGTIRGVDRYDPATGSVESFSTADGLPAGFVLELTVDRRGRLWVGTARGVGRFESGPHVARPTRPSVLITDLEVDGAARPIAALGSRLVAPVTVPGERSRVRIGFTAPGVDAPSFRYRLSGFDATWSAPTGRHDVEFAGMHAGNARFEVRLAGAEAGGAPVEASVVLRVPAPLWRRPWFLALGAAVLLGIAWTVHRARLRRALALERQRTRIAMDLHDEIGSGLGSIGLMADMAGSETTDEAARRGLAAQIGDVASDLGSSLAELVGTLRPGGATLESLAKQLAERGRRLFPGGTAVLATSFPDAWPAEPTDLAVRRDVFLIGAEALHNAARHAGASSVRLSLAAEGSRWILAVEDDGRGIEATAGEGGGLGLESMRRRARRIGAELTIEPLPGGGTRVALKF